MNERLQAIAGADQIWGRGVKTLNDLNAADLASVPISKLVGYPTNARQAPMGDGNWRSLAAYEGIITISAVNTDLPAPVNLAALWYIGTGGGSLRSMLDRGRRPSLEENDHETHALVEALLAEEDWPALRGVLPVARERARAMPILGPVCDRAEAMAFLADGSPERAIPLLRQAASWFAHAHVPLELARTSLRPAGLARSVVVG